ncbi:hypothetical protein ACH5RR_009482 [Cinchona calisaya]|uniref:Uncharacterized protein n=1 Tax=Cinchona calisaya TaxID=153742 RepID=A0ABD3AHP3_9GENT
MLIGKEDPDVVFLMKTKCNEKIVEVLKHSLSMFDLVVLARGLDGGLGLLWKTLSKSIEDWRSALHVWCKVSIGHIKKRENEFRRRIQAISQGITDNVSRAEILSLTSELDD